MGLIYYKPNPKKSGTACNWTFNSKTGAGKAVFLEIIKQTSWDDKNKTGGFKNGDKINIKFGYEKEVGAFLRVLSDTDPVKLNGKVNPNPNQNAKFYHTSEAGTKTINFTKSVWNGNVLYGLSVTDAPKDGEKSTYRVSFDADEAYTLKRWFEFALERIFTGIYADDKKYFENKDKVKKSVL